MLAELHLQTERKKETGLTQLPPTYRRFAELNPAVSTAYESLGDACAQAGPLDSKARELIKLALAVGATASEIRHVVTLAVTTLGFPKAAAAFTWIEDVLGPS